MSVLDTTFFIDLHRRDLGASRLWASIFSGDVTAAYSSVTVFELWLGTLTPDEADFYENLFLLLEEVPLTASAARRAAISIRALAPSTSERLIRDAMVAASAFERGEAVCTRNVRDMARFHTVETY